MPPLNIWLPRSNAADESKITNKRCPQIPVNAAPYQRNAAFTQGWKEKPWYNLIIYTIQTFTILSQQNKGDIGTFKWHDINYKRFTMTVLSDLKKKWYRNKCRPQIHAVVLNWINTVLLKVKVGNIHQAICFPSSCFCSIQIYSEIQLFRLQIAI